MPLSEEQIAEIEARARAATPGPWSVWWTPDRTLDILSEAEHPYEPLLGFYGKPGHYEQPAPEEKADAAFIAAARSDVPALIADLSYSQAEARRLRDQLRIASDALEHIVQIADRGADGPLIGVYAHDALIRVSVVE